MGFRIQLRATTGSKKKTRFPDFLTSAVFKKRHLLEVKQIIKYKRFELPLCDVRYIVLMMI